MEGKKIMRLVGVSGSGKTTLGRILAKELSYTYIDLDDFYLPNKPKIHSLNPLLNNDKNWDTLDAINISAFQAKIKETLGNIIVGGFVLIDNIFPIEPNFTICLEAGKTEEEIISRTIETRKLSKGFTGDKAKKDEAMVREIVYPYYRNMLSKTTINAYLCTYENNRRIPIDNLINIILSFIKD